MWLIATTITVFVGNVRVMADEYSGTILQRHKVQPSRYTALQVTDLSFDSLQTTTHSSANSRTVTDVNYLENPSNESRDTTKKLPVFQVKCLALLTDRSQTYIGCTN